MYSETARLSIRNPTDTLYYKVLTSLHKASKDFLNNDTYSYAHFVKELENLSKIYSFTDMDITKILFLLCDEITKIKTNYKNYDTEVFKNERDDYNKNNYV